MNKPIKTRPLTDKFIHDLRLKMQEHPKVTKVSLAEMLQMSKQQLHCYFKRTKNPCSETLLKIQELLRSNFMRMFL